MDKKNFLTGYGWILILLIVQFVLLRALVLEQKRHGEQSIRLRIAYYPSQITFSTLSPYGKGFEAELVESFCVKYGLEPVWREVGSFLEGFELLRSGKADLFLGGGNIPPDNLTKEAMAPLTIHQWMLSKLELHPLYRCVSGPAYRQEKILLVHSESFFPLEQESDLCTSTVLLPPSIVRDDWLKKSFAGTGDCDESSQAVYAKPGVKEFLDILKAREARFGLVPERLFSCWQPLYPTILPTAELDMRFPMCWYWNTSNAGLGKKLSRFLSALPKKRPFHELNEKYFGFFPEKTDRFQLVHLKETLVNKVPLYKDFILAAGKKYSIDPLLLCALIYQESHFNSSAVSRTGVGGLLQLSMDTAERLGVTNRFHPEQAIDGGARYLRLLWDELEDMNLTPWDRLYFTLASYNQGSGHVRDVCLLAEDRGLNPKKWQDIKKVFPLLAQPRYYRKLKHGYSRGYEVVTFVENIRYYYYILYASAFLGLEESKNLTFLLQGRPDRWP